MSHNEERFLSREGLQLYQQCWLPDTDYRATIVIIHGVTEHSGRYVRLASDLNRQGYGVYAMDLRGHGKSDGPRIWIDSFENFLDDVEIFLDRVAESEPGKPIFLLGHSMGSLIVAKLAITHPPKVRGLIFSAPPILVGGKVFPILRHLAAFTSRVCPRLRLVNLGYNFLSRDRKVVEDFKNDPLVYHEAFPVRTGAEILRTAKQIQRRLYEIRLPILVMHGTGDVVANAEGSRLLYTRASSSDKTLRLYEGLYHEIFSEPERVQVIGDLIDWLNARAG
jgi:acylglycerol lipase